MEKETAKEKGRIVVTRINAYKDRKGNKIRFKFTENRRC